MKKNLTIRELLSVADKLIERMKMLGNPRLALAENGLIPPDYDSARGGGFLCLLDRKEKTALQYQAGHIPHKSEVPWFTKAAKYAAYAYSKCYALLLEPEAIFSDLTEFAVAGGWVCDESVIIGFSGRTPLEDEAFCIAFAYLVGWLSDERLQLVRNDCKNPYLLSEVFELLVMDQEAFNARLAA